jgi:hypothetical protein
MGLRSMNMSEVAALARQEAGICVACPTSP